MPAPFEIRITLRIPTACWTGFTSHVKSVRLMLTWEAVQSNLNGPIPPAGSRYADYWEDLVGAVTRLSARGIYVILAPWQWNEASADTDIVYRGAPFSPADFASFWGTFATAIKGATRNDQRVAFDLINEPHTHAESGNKPGDLGISKLSWFACAQAAITAIRTNGAANTIFIWLIPHLTRSRRRTGARPSGGT